MKYPKSVLHRDGWRFKADIQHRTRRRGGAFWIIIYSHQKVGFEGWIHLPDDWQDVSRTYTPQDIYWDDKYDCTVGRRGAALLTKKYFGELCPPIKDPILDLRSLLYIKEI